MTAAVVLMGTALLVPVDEKGLFHIPTDEDFRFQRIARTDNERGWPFSVDEGYLACARVMGDPTVYFTTIEDEPDDARTVIVSTDPLDLAFVNMGSNDLFAPFSGLEELIPLVAPFERLGERLCEQPRGADLGPGEL